MPCHCRANDCVASARSDHAMQSRCRLCAALPQPRKSQPCHCSATHRDAMPPRRQRLCERTNGHSPRISSTRWMRSPIHLMTGTAIIDSAIQDHQRFFYYQEERRTPLHIRSSLHQLCFRIERLRCHHDQCRQQAYVSWCLNVQLPLSDVPLLQNEWQLSCSRSVCTIRGCRADCLTCCDRCDLHQFVWLLDVRDKQGTQVYEQGSLYERRCYLRDKQQDSRFYVPCFLAPYLSDGCIWSHYWLPNKALQTSVSASLIIASTSSILLPIQAITWTHMLLPIAL